MALIVSDFLRAHPIPPPVELIRGASRAFVLSDLGDGPPSGPVFFFRSSRDWGLVTVSRRGRFRRRSETGVGKLSNGTSDVPAKLFTIGGGWGAVEERPSAD